MPKATNTQVEYIYGHLSLIEHSNKSLQTIHTFRAMPTGYVRMDAYLLLSLPEERKIHAQQMALTQSQVGENSIKLY